MFDFLKRFKRHKLTPPENVSVVRTYQHIVGITTQDLSADEKDMVANLSPVITKILSNKLLVVNAQSFQWSVDEFMRCKGKVLVLEELISYFIHYKESLEQEKIVVPVSRLHH